MDKLLRNIKFLNDSEIAGVEVIIKNDNSKEFNLIILKKHKLNLSIEKTHNSILSTEELIKYLPSKIAVCIILNGKGILVKKVEAVNDEDEISILNKLLPNAILNDFYIQRSDVRDNQQFVAVARKEIIDKVLDDLKYINMHVVDLTIGPISFGSIIPLFKPLPGEVWLPHYKILTNSSQINEYVPFTDNDHTIVYQIGDEKITNQSILAFAGAFQYMVIRDCSPTSYMDKIRQSYKEHRYYNALKVSRWGILIILFSILLINWLVFEFYNQKYDKLSTKVSGYNTLLNNYNNMNAELEQKQALLEESGMLNSSRISYYADRLVVNLPEGIKLTEMNINPHVGKKTLMDETEFINKSILISGTTTRSTELNDWIKVIKQYEWIEEVKNFNYAKNQNSNNNNATFTMKLTLN